MQPLLLSGFQILTSTAGDIWTGPGFRLTSSENRKRS